MDAHQDLHSGGTLESHPVGATIRQTAIVVALAVAAAVSLHLLIGRYYNTAWYDAIVALALSAAVSPLFLYPSNLLAHKLRQANATITEQARIDYLTQLPNYFALRQEIACRLSTHDNDGGLAVHFIDLNRFK